MVLFGQHDLLLKNKHRSHQASGVFLGGSVLSLNDDLLSEW
jgi:hypothetical protein